MTAYYISAGRVSRLLLLSTASTLLIGSFKIIYRFSQDPVLYIQSQVSLSSFIIFVYYLLYCYFHPVISNHAHFFQPGREINLGYEVQTFSCKSLLFSLLPDI